MQPRLPYPEAMTLETLRVLEEAAAEMFRALRQRLLPPGAADAALIEYDSWTPRVADDRGGHHDRQPL